MSQSSEASFTRCTLLTRNRRAVKTVGKKKQMDANAYCSPGVCFGVENGAILRLLQGAAATTMRHVSSDRDSSRLRAIYTALTWIVVDKTSGLHLGHRHIYCAVVSLLFAKGLPLVGGCWG